MAILGSNFEDRHKTLLAHVDYLFSKKRPFLDLCQTTAEHFYPERADFTIRRSLSDEFASNLSTSYPLLMRRQLGDQMSAMLRPTGTTWAHMITSREDQLDLAGRQWLESKTKVMMRAINDPIARFVRATKEADHDFAAFGQAAISVEVNRAQSSLLYRCWHLKDMVWCEKYDGSIGLRARRWNPPARTLMKLFPGKIHPNVEKLVTANSGANAYQEIEVRHVVVPADEYDGPKGRFPWVSLFVDVANKFIMEETFIPTGYYVIPRWQTVSGSQYAYSPATVAALPDARLLQAITFTLLKAGEKAVDPPMIAVEEAVRSPIDITAGGVTFVDADYDEKTGEVLRPMNIDSRGIPVSLNMQDRISAAITSAFYIDKMQLPQFDHEMTAYEVSKRLQEYIRQALPLFGPIEHEYNAPLCEDTFTLLMLNNAFGSVADIPPSLSGADIRFRFESPLVEAADEQLVQTFQDTANLLQMAATWDPGAYDMVDTDIALRDALRGRSVPAKWMRSEEDAAALSEKRRAQQDMQQQLAVAQQGADVANSIGQAAQTMAPSK